MPRDKQVIRPIHPGEPLLGDYGDQYWAAGLPSEPSDGEREWQALREGLVISAMSRRLMQALQGRTAAFPIDISHTVAALSAELCESRAK